MFTAAEEMHVNREISFLLAEAAMRIREELESEHEAMVQARRGRRCAISYRVKKF